MSFKKSYSETFNFAFDNIWSCMTPRTVHHRMTESQNIPSGKPISSFHMHSFHLLNWAKAVYINHSVNATDKDRTQSP